MHEGKMKRSFQNILSISLSTSPRYNCTIKYYYYFPSTNPDKWLFIYRMQLGIQNNSERKQVVRTGHTRT